jgi:hypothetical protein
VGDAGHDPVSERDSEIAALRVLLASRNGMLERLWTELARWEASEEPARVVVADLRRRGLMPTE